MEKQFWHDKWEQDEIWFNQAQPGNYLTKYFNLLELKSGATVFVPLCGKSVDMLWLAEQGYQVIGLELSHKACRQFFEENNLVFTEEDIDGFKILSSPQVKLISGDFFAMNSEVLGPIDAIYDRAALIALPPPMRLEYSKKLIDCAQPHTQMLLLTMKYNEKEMEGPPFSVEGSEVNSLFDTYFNIQECHHEEFDDISEHLKVKGLKRAEDFVYHLKHL